MQESVIIRSRLLERLAQRWDRRVVTVVAGPGFGKTQLLAAAASAPAGHGRRDVWLSCEPADESAEHLAAGLATALGFPSGSDIHAVLEAVWARAPEDLCILLDDVHEIPAGSSGAALLDRLVTDLSANGHLLFASREAIPVRLARLSAGGEVLRVTDDELVFSREELASFAASRGVDAAILGSTGGWPALAELTVSARSELVLGYLWEEVLGSIGPGRAHLLAQLIVAGGGNDEVVSALAGRPTSVNELVTSIPLVQRSAGGWVALHPLWQPALRGLLTDEEVAAARGAAAEVHRRNRRYGHAVDLFEKAGAWEGVLTVIREAERDPSPPREGPPLPDGPPSIQEVGPADFGRWNRLLPQGWRDRPEALLAAGLELQGSAPSDAVRVLCKAVEAFRVAGDADGELIAISHEGLVRSWLGDVDGLVGLFPRVHELAEAGSEGARVLAALGAAGWAHCVGDSAGVLSALAGIDDRVDAGWLPQVCWLRSSALRRNGELAAAHLHLDGIVDRLGFADAYAGIARLRIEWLEGDVDRVASRLAEHFAASAQSGDRFLARESGLEAAGKAAWLGDVGPAQTLLADARSLLPGSPNVVAAVLDVIAAAALAVGEADEAGAATLLADASARGPAPLGSPEGWYWRDRAAIALLYVLVPATRSRWAAEPLGPAHLPGLRLAEALVAARDGDLDAVRILDWPAVGLVRAHLPLPWVVELAAAGVAAGNPPPEALLGAAGPKARTTLRAVATESGAAPIAVAAQRLAKGLPLVPSYRLRIGVLGPLAVWRDGVAIEAPEFRRQRVRELLCCLVARGKVRREVVGDELWPDLADPAQNLRVTLNYLQRVLQPDRGRGEPPYFVQAGGDWLQLVATDHLEVDLWELDARLDDAETAERAGTVTAALAAYRAALPLWRDEPFADALYAMWAEPERARITPRYVGAACRAGELWLAARAVDDASRAASFAIVADPTSERARRLQARALLANDDRASAKRALERAIDALAGIGVDPDETTTDLLASLSRP